MNDGELTITPRDGNTARRPGEVLEVLARWTLAEMPETIEARLYWFTSGKGDEDCGECETQPASPSAQGEHRFKFKLPRGPYSFTGQLISLQWAVELVADADESTPWEFTLSPTGKAIVLGKESARRRQPK